MEELKKALSYDPKNGVLIWTQTNAPAGGLRHKKYLSVRYRTRQYNYAPVCWYLHHGTWPVGVIDHIDGDPSNNRIDNLRDVTRRGNQQNLKCHRDGNLVGATYFPKRNSYLSRVYVAGTSIFLGWYRTEEEAHISYLLFLELL